MKRVLSLLVLVALLCTALVGCKDPELTYSLAVVVDSSVNATNNKVTNVALALVVDADNKIVAARFDSSETTPKIDQDGAFEAVASVQSKVEQGDGYSMPAGSWAAQAKAFENAIVGKTADEVANLDASAYAGCTMQATTPVFKSLVAKAFAYTGKVTFKTAETVTVGIAMDMTVGTNGKVGCDIAGTVVAGGKVVACALDSVEQAFTAEAGVITAAALKVSKNEQGDGYMMPKGSWAKQAQAFANSAVGKTVSELADLETVSDALAAAGCTMKNTTAGYKTTIITAAGYAR